MGALQGGLTGPSRRWLCNEAIDAGTRRWAVEGLAYLTFDADVKEEFVEDKAAMQAMFQLAKVSAVGGMCPSAPPMERVVGLGCAQGPGGAEWAQALLCPASRVRPVSRCPCSQRTGACSMQLPPR